MPGPGSPPPALPKLSVTWAELRGDVSLKGRAWSAAAGEAATGWLEAAFTAAVGAGAGRKGGRPEGVFGRRARRERSSGGDIQASALAPEAFAGLALVAVGSLGRGDMAPASDLDLLLVHNGRTDVGQVADRLWYPIWDDPMPLDHSVRSLAQVEQAAEADLRVAQGLLDARPIAGDPDLGGRAVGLGRRLWEKRVTRWLPQVMATREEAWAQHGDVAFLLEPEIQEGRGGLRDLQALSIVSRVTPLVAGVVDDDGLGAAGDLLHSVRVELQRVGGRRADRLMLDDQERVAEALGLSSREELAHRVAEAGRKVAWVTEDAFRRARSWLAGPAGRKGSADRPIGPGLVLRDNEVVVPVASAVKDDPTLPLRAATASAQLGASIARASLARLVAEAPVPGEPWDEEVLRAFVGLLGSGGPGVHAIETLDQLGLWERYMPEWPRVRNRPQFNPYHRWSVDRHLLETAAGAATQVRQVRRPDLLLLGGLLHDIGKGAPGDHSEVGAMMARRAVARMGLAPADVEVLERVVRLHLLLPEVATRRDLDDPATVRSVAEAVEDETTLEVLTALAAADGEATGTSAWSEWKANLVTELSHRAQALLAGRPVPEGPPFPTDAQRRMLAQGGVQVHRAGRQMVVVAPDHPGLFSEVTGTLALHGIGVLEARAHSEKGNALEVFTLDLAENAQPRWERLTTEIEAAALGRSHVSEALARRQPPRPGRRAGALVDPRTWVLVDNEGATSASIVEVRAPDAPGALHRITAAIAAEGLDIVSARISTIGGGVIDTFYVRTDDGKIGPGQAAEELRRRLLDRLAAAPGQP